MKTWLKYELNRLMRVFVFLVILITFQGIVIPTLANQVPSGQNQYTGISEIYTYDEIESSVGAEVNLTDGLSRVLLVKRVRPNHEVLNRCGECCR